MRPYTPFQILCIWLPVAVSFVLVGLLLSLFTAEDFFEGAKKASQLDISRPAWMLMIPSALLAVVLYLFVRANREARVSLAWLCLSGLAGGILPVAWLYSDVTRLALLPSYALYGMPVVYTFGMVLGLFLGWSLLWIAAHFD